MITACWKMMIDDTEGSAEGPRLCGTMTQSADPKKARRCRRREVLDESKPQSRYLTRDRADSLRRSPWQGCVR